MRNTRHVVLSVVFVTASAGAAAAQTPHPGFSATVRIGTSSMNTPTVRDREGPGLQGYDRRDRAWAVSGGHEWRVGERLDAGIEVEYADNGTATITYASSNVYGFTSTAISVLGSAGLRHGRLSVGVKAGVARTRTQYAITTYVSGTPDLNSERTRDLPVAGFAAGYDLSRRLTLVVDARRAFGDKADTVTRALVPTNPAPPPFRDVLNAVPRVTTVSVGCKVRF
jgi:hypothetical protein